MEQTPDKTKPPSTSYRETFRRHRKLFSLPVVLGALAAGAVVFSSGGTYKSTASLWVDTAAPLASSVGASITPPLSTPPAPAEQGILNELLTTQSFAVSVAKTSLLGNALGNATSLPKKAPDYLQNGQVTTTVTGEQILKITYSASSPAIAQSVLNAIVVQLRKYNDGLTAQHDQAAVSYDTEQVKLAKSALTAARNNVNSYLAQHPGASQADPNLLALTAAENNAVTQLGQANDTLSQATGTQNASGWSIQVLDAARPGIAPAVGKKKMLEVILGGAFGGLLLSFLVVVAVTPAKKEAWEDELPVGTPFAPSVPTAVPFNGQQPAGNGFGRGHTPTPTAVGPDGLRLLKGERRLTLRRPSEHVEER